MKRFLALPLAVLMVLGLCACGNDDSSNGAATEPAKGGCGSTVTFGLAAILVAAAAVVVRKKD